MEAMTYRITASHQQSALRMSPICTTRLFHKDVVRSIGIVRPHLLVRRPSSRVTRQALGIMPIGTLIHAIGSFRVRLSIPTVVGQPFRDGDPAGLQITQQIPRMR